MGPSLKCCVFVLVKNDLYVVILEPSAYFDTCRSMRYHFLEMAAMVTKKYDALIWYRAGKVSLFFFFQFEHTYRNKNYLDYCCMGTSNIDVLSKQLSFICMFIFISNSRLTKCICDNFYSTRPTKKELNQSAQ